MIALYRGSRGIASFVNDNYDIDNLIVNIGKYFTNQPLCVNAIIWFIVKVLS